MKNWLVCILLFITASGTFVPCCSVDDCCTDRLVNTTNHDKHKNEGTCSPFFACATCPASAELAKSVQLDFLAVGSLIHHQQIMEFTLPSYSYPFWKPPRSC